MTNPVVDVDATPSKTVQPFWVVIFVLSQPPEIVIRLAEVPLVALLNVSVILAPPVPEALLDKGARIDKASEPVVPDQMPLAVTAEDVPPVSRTTAVPLIVLMEYQVALSEETKLFKV